MFSNAIIFRLPSGFPIDLEDLEEVLQSSQFIPCGSTQARSSGWVPPRGDEHGALAELVNGQILLKLQTETKTVPAQVIQRNLDERVKAYKDETGRERVSSKIKKEFKEEITLNLLPRAFSRQSASLVWIDTMNNLLVVDAGSHAAADDVVSELVRTLDNPGLVVRPLETNGSPTYSMARWLLDQQAPAGFSVDRECELKATDESGAVVRYGKHSLLLDEITSHINDGKLPTLLALTFGDGVSFVLTDALALKKIKLLDVVLEGLDDDSRDDFDVNFALVTCELGLLIPALVEALGGELETESEF